jgi:predicted small secreted protein
MQHASAAATALVILAASWLAACNRGASSDAGDAGTDDGAADAPSPGDDATESTVTIETPADAALADAAPLPAACADYDAGAPPYASLAGGTVAGTGVSATVCAATEVYLSAYLSPANRLLLHVAGAVSTDFQSPANATEGTLALMVTVGTDTPAVYTSAESQSCGFVAFTYALPSGAVT